MSILVITALLRMVILGWVFWDSFKHRDVLGAAIAFVYSTSIAIVTIGGHRELTSVLATPLVCLIAWHIFKTHRRKYEL